jgi:hypothetical protein
VIYWEGQPSFFNAMINENTPYKLAEIIRDTWPNLYRTPTKKKNEKGIQSNTETREKNQKS